MRSVTSLMTLGAALALLGGGTASAQQAMPAPTASPGPGMAMMGDGPDMGMERDHYGDPAAYLDGLKTDLKITQAQEPAWNAYTDAVKSHAEKVRQAHQTLYDAMGTATWQERRDMMNRMFETRPQSFDAVRAAAEKLMPSLTPEQRAQAAGVLPGLRGPGHRMMGRTGPGMRSRSS